MSKLITFLSTALLLFSTSVSYVNARDLGLTLAVTMTNDPTSNQIQVYDTGTGALVQTLSTNGKGGVAGNARGIREHDGQLFAAVNNGSSNVAIFKREGNRLAFDKLVTATSAPVSVDFSSDHMYVAGATTVDSFVLDVNNVGAMDGTTGLAVVGGAAPPAGSTAQVGFVNEREVLVTLKDPPASGEVDVVALKGGKITGAVPTVVQAPAGSLTPFGFSVYPDGTAVITLAHSSQDGLFRNGAFTQEIAAGQIAPCWMTRDGKYLFTANTGSKTISRLIGTGNIIFVDSPVAAQIATGGAPSDIDAAAGVLGVIDHVTGPTSAFHLSLFTYNAFGELTASGTPITVGSSANGIAIMPPAGRD